MKNFEIIFTLAIKSSITLLLIFLFSGCAKEPASIPASAIPIDTSNKPKTYLALGDSYTIGQSVAAEQRFPVQSTAIIFSQGILINSPEIIAVTGWTTGNLLVALNNNPPAKIYDFVSLLIGVNNQYQGRSKEEYKAEFSTLLSKAINYAGGRSNRVFVLSIPDYSVTPFARNSDTAAIARDIDAFNAINKQLTLQAGITYLDVTPISREARTDAALIATDGLHPSGKQYQRWAAILAPVMKASL